MNKLFLALPLLFSQSDWYSGKLEGWYYFQGSQGSKEELPPQEILEEERKQFEELLSLALLEPIDENIKNYLEASERQIARSIKFANACKKSHPNSLKKFGKNYFLLFAYQDHPDSKQGSAVALAFAKAHEWQMKALSLDGSRIEGIEHFEKNMGIADAIGIKKTPAFYAIDPVFQKVSFLGSGLMTLEDLEQSALLYLGSMAPSYIDEQR